MSACPECWYTHGTHALTCPRRYTTEASRMSEVKQGIGELLIKVSGALMVLAILYWMVGGGSPS